MAALRMLVIAGGLLSIASLLFLVYRASRAGRRPAFSAPRGDARRGILYAFTTGMMPWEKESAGGHLPTFVAGILYHLGIAAFVVYLIQIVVMPGRPLLPGGMRVLLAAGALAGLGLLIKRAVNRPLRALSCPDDYASNALVDACLLLAFASTYFREVEVALLIASLALFAYAPIGKIRHCFFFFYTRILFGAFFGRRGTYPASARSK